jgi:hypothetical protein
MFVRPGLVLDPGAARQPFPTSSGLRGENNDVFPSAPSCCGNDSVSLLRGTPCAIERNIASAMEANQQE